MDTSAQSQPSVQPQVLPVQPAPVSQPATVAPVQPVVSQPPPDSPVSLPHREAGPGLGRMSEFIMPTDSEPVLAREVKEAGVEVSANLEKPVIPADVAQAGVKPAHEAVPLQTVTGVGVQYIANAPFSEGDAIKVEKSRSASESIRWLATFFLRQLKKVKLIKA